MDPRLSDTTLLHTSRERAKRVLADSARQAQAMLDETHRQAVALLMEEQQRAAELLLGELGDAEDSREEVELAIESLPEDQREQATQELDDEAAEILSRQEAAAQMLAAAQHRAASTVSHAVESATADILLMGQKEAAAILLEARLRVKDRRLGRTPSMTPVAEVAR